MSCHYGNRVTIPLFKHFPHKEEIIQFTMNLTLKMQIHVSCQNYKIKLLIVNLSLV